MSGSLSAVAAAFDALPLSGGNFAEELHPGYSGLVVAQGRVRPMTWGFPLALRNRHGRTLKPKPVAHARDDRLLTGFWLPSFKARRCLVPVSAWADPEGRRGAMTRTWYRPAGEVLCAVAGLWTPTDEWGDAYTMVMTEACAQMAQAHDRMPVILPPEAWAQWVEGTADQALALCRPWSGDLEVTHTQEPWAGDSTGAAVASAADSQPLLPGLL